MPKEKFRVLLYLKKSALRASDEAPLMGRITLGRSVAQFSCKMTCPIALWDARASRLRGKSQVAVDKNREIEQLLVSLHAAYEELKGRGLEVSASMVKDFIQGRMSSEQSLLTMTRAFVEEQKERVGIDLKAHGFGSYLKSIERLEGFIRKAYGVDDLAFSQLEEDFIEEYFKYLQIDCGLKQGSCRLYGFILKKVCRRAYEAGILSRPLFMHYKIDRGDEALPRALDRESFERIRDLELHPLERDLERVRKLFLFSCYTGLAYADLFSVTEEHLCEDEYGALWLKFHRQKTKQLCRVKLLPEALRLLELCQGEGATLFEPMSYTRYSIAIRALGERAGLTKPLSSHMARHTMATLITLEQGVSLESVSKMLGHSDIQMTERYARVTPQKLFEDFERLIDYTKDLRLRL